MTGLLHTHKAVVILFILIYLIKTVLLFTNKTQVLENFTKKIKIPEMIISTAFLVTGIIMLLKLPSISLLLIIKIVIVLLSIPIAVIGFKKSNKALAALSLIMIFGVYGLAEANKKVRKVGDISSNVVTNSKDANYNILDHGKAIYEAADCKSCHGEDGDLGIAGAKKLSESNLTEQETIGIITNGKNIMKKYKAVLSEQEIKAVTSYVKTLRK